MMLAFTRHARTIYDDGVVTVAFDQEGYRFSWRGQEPPGPLAVRDIVDRLACRLFGPNALRGEVTWIDTRHSIERRHKYVFMRRSDRCWDVYDVVVFGGGYYIQTPLQVGDFDRACHLLAAELRLRGDA